MNNFDKKWEQKMKALYENKNVYKRNTLNESVGEDELIDFATKNYFNRWLDCDVNLDDLCDALLDGLYGKDFRRWDRIYGFGKDYEYLECAYDIGVNAASATDFEAFKALYESKNSALQTFRKSYSAKANKSLFEAKALTPEEKMDRWHNGTRKENIKACNIDKLNEYRKICRAKGYTEQVKIINAELKRRKDEGINESRLLSRGINLQPGGEFYNMDKDTFMSIYDILVKKYGEDRIIYNELGYGIVTLWLDEIGPNGYEIIFWSELGTLIDVDLLRHLLPGSIFV